MILYYVACDANTVVVDDDRTRVPIAYVVRDTDYTIDDRPHAHDVRSVEPFLLR